ncbi:unnamed protein product [marine sediment metagenome]|uniref:Uncharacterized protein n=1 Tax=marine sediment metagenome TaxID=412755 RepID=X0SI67_9ZZZZ
MTERNMIISLALWAGKNLTKTMITMMPKLAAMIIKGKDT